jgi:hypothetical protein
VADLAAQGRFSGVVMLARRGRTVLSRSYGMADAHDDQDTHHEVLTAVVTRREVGFIDRKVERPARHIGPSDQGKRHMRPMWA